MSGFLVGLPVAVALGSPISTALLGLDGLFGLRGWQVMYIAEAVPTVVLGVITYFVLTDKPEQAKFLTAEERNWLVSTIAAERRATEAVRRYTLWEALYNPKVLLLALNYLGIVTASLGMLFFIPQIIKSLGNYSNMTVGWLTMIPYICGGIAMVVWGRVSDRMDERRWNLFFACVFSTVGLVIAGMTMGTWWALVGMSIAAMGFYGSKGPFFAMPPMFLSGAGARGGHCLDQLARQSRRLLRALVCRRHEGPDRQLRRRAVRAGPARLHLGAGVRAVPAHPETEAGGAGGGRGAGGVTSLFRLQAPKLPQRGREQQDGQQRVAAGVADLGDADDAEESTCGEANVGPCRIGGERGDTIGRLLGCKHRTRGAQQRTRQNHNGRP